MSKKKRPERQPKYADEVLRKAQATRLLRGRVFTIGVAHDDWCRLLAGKGQCNCNPTVCEPVLVPMPQDN